ncbi:MAG: hypothetical protein ABIM59_08155 [candidate division WOR-3 bacterium]
MSGGLFIKHILGPDQAEFFQGLGGRTEDQLAEKFLARHPSLPLRANYFIQPPIGRHVDISAGIHSRRIRDHHPLKRTYEDWLSAQVQVGESPNQFLNPLFHLVRRIAMPPGNPQNHPAFWINDGKTISIREVLVFHNPCVWRKGLQGYTKDLILISEVLATSSRGACSPGY